MSNSWLRMLLIRGMGAVSVTIGSVVLFAPSASTGATGGWVLGLGILVTVLGWAGVLLPLHTPVAIQRMTLAGREHPALPRTLQRHQEELADIRAALLVMDERLDEQGLELALLRDQKASEPTPASPEADNRSAPTVNADQLQADLTAALRDLGLKTREAKILAELAIHTCGQDTRLEDLVCWCLRPENRSN